MNTALDGAPELVVRVEGRAGRITLNRPQALNALTHAMALEIRAALDRWANDDRVSLVLVDGVGDRAFCAGGDLQELYRTGRDGNFDYGRRFWTDEYRLNAAIAGYPKPYVALMDGIVMGGGVGLAAHGSHRIVTEKTMLAMPECGIGLIPDVGSSCLLGHAPDRLGLYLGLTGARLTADDAIHAGFADVFVPQDRLFALTGRLVATGDAAVMDEFTAEPPAGNVALLQPDIDAVFSADDPVEILARLEAPAAAERSWQAKAAKAIRRASPLSIQCAFATIGAGRDMNSIREALALEYRFVSRCMGEGDLLEGIRAQIIDKDRAPNWRHSSLDAARDDAARMLRPLARELEF